LPDGIKGSDTFGVDHYRPTKRFPGLESTYSNLFYSCNCCNSRKGQFWPTDDQLRAGEFIPNPCDHVMFEHLQYQGVTVYLKSAAGVLADRYMGFNDPVSLDYRQFVVDMIACLEGDRQEISETLTLIERRIRESPELSETLGSEKAAAEQGLARINQNLLRLSEATPI
jgi:HNH endonuclease